MEFKEIAPFEFGKSLLAMIEPGAQFGARCDLLAPKIERSCFPADTAWPEPVDENPNAIGRVGFLVYTLGCKRRHSVLALCGLADVCGDGSSALGEPFFDCDLVNS